MSMRATIKRLDAGKEKPLTKFQPGDRCETLSALRGWEPATVVGYTKRKIGGFSEIMLEVIVDGATESISRLPTDRHFRELVQESLL